MALKLDCTIKKYIREKYFMLFDSLGTCRTKTKAQGKDFIRYTKLCSYLAHKYYVLLRIFKSLQYPFAVIIGAEVFGKLTDKFNCFLLFLSDSIFPCLHTAIRN